MTENDAVPAIGSTDLFDILHPVTDALRWMDFLFRGRTLDAWDAVEMRDLKRETKRLSRDLAWLEDVYRGMVALRRDWGYSAGRPDVNQFETWERGWESYLSNTGNPNPNAT